MKANRKAGPITLAVGLIFFGCVMLVSNITGTGLWESVFKWPSTNGYKIPVGDT